MKRKNITPVIVVASLLVIAMFVGCSTQNTDAKPTVAPADNTDTVSQNASGAPVLTDAPAIDPTNTAEPEITYGPATEAPPVVTEAPTTDAPTNDAPTVDTPNEPVTPPAATAEPTAPATEIPVTAEPPVTTATAEPPVTEPPHTHSYTAKVVAPTCTEKGYTLHTCACGDSYRDNEQAALGHDWHAATCTEPRKCVRCGRTEGSALGHNYGDWVVITEPTIAAEGLREKTCTRCGDKIQEAIPKLIDPNAPEVLEFVGTEFLVILSNQKVKVGDTFTMTVFIQKGNAAAFGVQLPEPASLSGIEVVSAKWKGDTVLKTWDNARNLGSVLYEGDTNFNEIIVITLKATSAGQVTVPVYVCAKTRTGTDHVFKETVNVTLIITN